MKALTVKQPWASFIVHGIQDIKNSKCETNYRGRVLIYAAADKKFMNIPPSDFMTDDQIDAYEKNCFDFPMQERKLYSVIIGSVEIVDCVKNHPSIWAKKGVCNWVLANPVLFEKPIPAKGKLSFWEYDGELPFDEILEANKDVLERIKEKGD
jgi:hypothetical protein|nr:MAG TPA: ASCH domain protein [Bacteriophage sp.]